MEDFKYPKHLLENRRIGRRRRRRRRRRKTWTIIKETTRRIKS
jgi:hypothetical protein